MTPHPTNFHADGEPVAQPRPRARAMKINGKWMAQVYNVKDADPWKACVAEAASHHVGQRVIAEAVAIVITFWMPRPLSHYGTGRNAQILKPGAPTWHTVKPDIDNLIKPVLDALNGIEIWSDDCKVAGAVGWKRYANGPPGADIEIWPLTNEQLGFEELLAGVIR